MQNMLKGVGLVTSYVKLELTSASWIHTCRQKNVHVQQGYYLTIKMVPYCGDGQLCSLSLVHSKDQGLASGLTAKPQEQVGACSGVLH